MAAIQERTFERSRPSTSESFRPATRLTAEQLSAYLDRRAFAAVCTGRPDGRPHAAMTSYFRRDDVFWLPTVADAVRTRNITSQPWISLVVTEGDKDEHVVVIIEGTAEAISPETCRRMWSRRSTATGRTCGSGCRPNACSPTVRQALPRDPGSCVVAPTGLGRRLRCIPREHLHPNVRHRRDWRSPRRQGSHRHGRRDHHRGCQAVAASAVPASTDARCLSGARAAGARIVGREPPRACARGDGINPGSAPPSIHSTPSAHPGGSSSGSAVAVATGAADVALEPTPEVRFGFPRPAAVSSGSRRRSAAYRSTASGPSPRASTRSVRSLAASRTSCSE